MKRFLCLVLVFLMTVSFGALAEYDVTSMTDEELHTMIDVARNELAKREIVLGENTVLVDQDGVTFYLTGEYSVHGDGSYIDFSCILINDSDITVGINIGDLMSASVNGWEVFASGIGSVAAGKKARGEITLGLEDAGISSYEELETIELELSLYDADKYETFAKLDPITLHFNTAA